MKQLMQAEAERCTRVLKLKRNHYCNPKAFDRKNSATLDPYFWLPRLIVAARERYLATTEIRTKTTILEEIPSAIRAYLVGEADSPIPALCETLEAADD